METFSALLSHSFAQAFHQEEEEEKFKYRLRSNGERAIITFEEEEAAADAYEAFFNQDEEEDEEKDEEEDEEKYKGRLRRKYRLRSDAEPLQVSFVHEAQTNQQSGRVTVA
eukprot:Skav209458  [mRNA]  locus=scaffold4097:32091:34323:- [translate_table: standard]